MKITMEEVKVRHFFVLFLSYKIIMKCLILCKHNFAASLMQFIPSTFSFLGKDFTSMCGQRRQAP